VSRMPAAIAVCLVLFGCDSPRQTPAKSAQMTTKQAYKPGLRLPKAEIALVEAVQDCSRRFVTAGDAGKRSSLRAERAAALKGILSSQRAFKGWIGTLADLSTTADGHAFVRIDMPGTKISVGTWGDPVSDKLDRTLIRPQSPLYRKLSDLGIGTLVSVSGRFVAASDDYIAESSLNEAGAMKTPTFIARFDDIRPFSHAAP
jgi:hypothetical protein